MKVNELLRMSYPENYGFRSVHGGENFVGWYWCDGEIKHVETYGGIPRWFPNIDAAYNAAKLAWEQLNSEQED